MDPTFIPEDYYYDKGALLGLLLDIRIRDATANRHSLDDVMAQLYREHYLHGSGFSTEDFLSYVGEHVGDEVARAFYRDYVDGREPLPFQQALALAAMRYEADSIVEPFLGVAVTPLQDGDLRVSTVQPGSAAARAGLQPGDILISVGDVELEDQNWGGEFRRLYSGAGGERIKIHYERNGRRMSSEATIETRTRYVHRLQPVTNASERARSIRAGILGGDV